MYANDAALLNGRQMNSVEARPRGRSFGQVQGAMSLAFKANGAAARIGAWIRQSHGEAC